MTRQVLLVLVLAACSAQETPPAEARNATPRTDDDTLATVVRDTTLPPMPDFPVGHKDHLVVTSVGDLDMSVTWRAHAGRCQDPSLLVMIAEEEKDGGGASLLLRLLPHDSVPDTYPVVASDTTGLPEPPAARLGFQFLRAGMADSYQATAGSVDLIRLDPSRVSARFAVTLRHVGVQRLSHAAGVFDGVPIQELSPEWCRRAAPDQDSVPGRDP